MGGETLAMRSPLGSTARKRLADISNLPPPPELAVLKPNSSGVHNPSGDLFNRLLQSEKEKAALLQLVEERDKMLALRATEMQNLHRGYQTVLLQNRSLAQSNSQMSAEVNTARDRVSSASVISRGWSCRLRVLQHEVACKDALLKARSSELEGKPVTEHQDAVPQVREEVIAERLQKANNGKKPCNRGRVRATRSQSLGPSTSQVEVEKEKAETKRQCLRRQSARFKSPEREPPAEELFEIEDTKSAVSPSSRMQEDTSEPGSEALVDAAASHRSSIGRPVRRAAVKVQSYKEPSLTQKMRRPE
ncbi:unnamed protein product [Linum tenue]|uniref:Shugoshin C-terminal domain-containing protein n=1 Tax=Linum tenue TaxID=586396 RepID=A0AAV0IKI2_9ROSI|nr:unnamed protein product [Linum tenue]